MKRSEKRHKPRSEGLRLTKVGLWFLIFALVIFFAAINTGNNGLYLALVTMLGMFVTSQLLARLNISRLALECESLPEIFANRPAPLRITVGHRGWWLPRWLLLVTVPRLGGGEGERNVKGFLLPRLAAGEQVQRVSEILVRRRGRHSLPALRVASLFPLGFFRKQMRFPIDREILVFPEIFSPSNSQPEQPGTQGELSSRRSGWGHELHGLRRYRAGDDPRSIHWKQSARLGRLIFQERESEESRRLAIVFDNAVGELTDADRPRFERLVSEAATAALDYLNHGYQVQLITRDEILPFATGSRQRRRILEHLALVEPRPRSRRPLEAPANAGPSLRIAMEPDSASQAKTGTAA